MSIFAKVSKRSLRTLVVTTSLLALSTTVACVSAERTDSESTASEAANAEQVAAEHHRRGPVGVVVDTALEYGDLSADQIDAITAIGEAHTSSKDERAALREQMRGAAAKVVRAGTSDSDEFDAAVEQATDAMEKRMQTGAASMKAVHETLSEEQRIAVADALHDQLEQRWSRRRGKAKRDGTGFKKAAAHLMLSALQVDKLKAVAEHLKARHNKRDKHREEIEALIDAFETNEFGATLDAFHADKLEQMRSHLTDASEKTDTVLSILTDGQRDLLAEMIERGPRAVLLGEETAAAAQ